jgi:hypothetical protein
MRKRGRTNRIEVTTAGLSLGDRDGTHWHMERVWDYAPKAPGLVSEGQRPGSSVPHTTRALKGQDSRGVLPFQGAE